MSSHTDFADASGAKGVDPNHPCASHLRILDAEAGLIERSRDKIAIVGYATSSRDAAPFDDPAYDIAGLNQIYRFLPREDIHMDIHVNWDEENVEGTDHKGWIQRCGIPVLMTKVHPDLPTSVAFPLQAVIGLATDYLTSSIAFYIAWAIHQGYKEIALYGIDLVVGTEYEHQKACAEFWLGVAHGKGIDLKIPQQSALLKHSHRYGYEKQPNWGPVSLDEFAARVAGLTEQRDKLAAKINAIDGALHEVLTIEKWKDDAAGRTEWLQRARAEALGQAAAIDGAAQESAYWKELLTLRHRGADIRLR